MRKTFKLFGAVAIAGLVATTGSAFTASNTVAPSIAGYGTSTISGATATALAYTLSADGTSITGSSLTFTGNQTGRTVSAGFGTATLTTCTVGTFDATASTTPVTCTGYSQSTASSSAYNVAVV
ncbi:MAG: hypothetical protein H7323_15460 [Frankiales bacterium]|nr:hypothetical protein [Frankiales bacterium]